MVPGTETPITEVIRTLQEGWSRKSLTIVVVAEGDEE
jgi:hypothetical protein